MRNKLYKILAAGIALAMAFTLSCSSDKDDGNSGSSFGDKGNDIAKYKKTEPIGNKVWMAENLNYAVPGSKCYGEGGEVLVGRDADGERIYKPLSNAEIQANCDKYGRLYDWATAKTVCPSGWHLPSDAEWTALETAVGGGETAGTKLKSASGWNTGSGYIPGTDNYGFSALPGGVGGFEGSSGYYEAVSEYGNWWSATESTVSGAYIRGMRYDYAHLYRSDDGKAYLSSVRCVKD